MIKRAHLFWLLIACSSSVFSQDYRIPVSPEGTINWGYADLNGNMVVPAEFIMMGKFSKEGAVLASKKEMFVYELIDRYGAVIATELDEIRLRKGSNLGVTIMPSFRDGCIVVATKKAVGCLNSQGELVVPMKYDQLTSFDRGFALARLKREFFVVTQDGKETRVQVSDIKGIRRFSHNLGMIEVKGGKWGFIDNTGKIAITPQFQSVGYFNDGLAWAKDFNSLVGYIDTAGNWIVKPVFSKARNFDKESGLAMIMADGKWGHIDKDGQLFFFSESEKAYDFSEGLTIAMKNEKFGFLNNLGEWVIEPKFDGVHKFNQGYAAVKVSGKWGLIDKQGKMIIEPKFTGIYSQWISIIE